MSTVSAVCASCDYVGGGSIIDARAFTNGTTGTLNTTWGTTYLNENFVGRKKLSGASYRENRRVFFRSYGRDGLFLEARGGNYQLSSRYNITHTYARSLSLSLRLRVASATVAALYTLTRSLSRFRV